jgi:hypothetical protein
LIGGFDSGEHHALIDDLFGAETEIAVGILLHLAHDQLLIEGAAIDADAHGFCVVTSDSADGGELLVAAFAGTDVAGIDAIFVEGASAIRIFGEQHVAVVVKIADERGVASGVQHALLDFGDGRGGFGNVDGDAHHLRSGRSELHTLLRGGGDIGGVGIGHGLNDDRRAAAHVHAANLHGIRLVSVGHHYSLPGRAARRFVRRSSKSECEHKLYRESRCQR